MSAPPTSADAFLGGNLRIAQPLHGFRSGIDAVLLAAAVPAAAGQSALELGCGAGAAALCLGHRVPGLDLHGLELQPLYADLARRNAAANAVPLTVWTGDLAAPPPELRARSFDHVLANPPYFPAGRRVAAADDGREAARGERLDLSAWIDAASRRLRPGGTLTVIQRIERLPDLLHAVDSRFGALRVLPLAPRHNRAPRLFILRAEKGRRSPFKLLPPLVLHQGDAHLSDAENYTETITCVLREGAALPWPAG